MAKKSGLLSDCKLLQNDSYTADHRHDEADGTGILTVPTMLEINRQRSSQEIGPTRWSQIAAERAYDNYYYHDGKKKYTSLTTHLSTQICELGADFPIEPGSVQHTRRPW